MAEIDRLSALMARFALRVDVVPVEEANLFVIDGPEGRHLFLRPRSLGLPEGALGQVAFQAHVDFGGAEAPLASALPDELRHPVGHDEELAAVIALMRAEVSAGRCGGASVLARLSEVLIVRLLRARLEKGDVPRGMLGGLADPRLARAIVAMHDRPGESWSNDDLAAEAGMSRSRFIARFRDAVGTSPQAYLRHWRLALAQQDVARGDRIDAVARRYGYGSPEALTHMFRRETGQAPITLRHGTA
ncbi:helix-turn-helix domain-containing protein [Aestuariivita boseongensis]|uniref:helix-turn-helix domain-containing protein n=1 Tax=Aestuariivita boseongensis TaxID=1470562 RepID=UPI0006810761|nr:AraC family transcriptional regulator [Aestuariivita boseongensis]